MKRYVPALLGVQGLVLAGALGWLLLRPAAPLPAHAGAGPASAAHEAPAPAAHPGARHGEAAAPSAAGHAAAPADPHATAAPHAAEPASHAAEGGRSATEILEALAAGNRRFAGGDRRERPILEQRRALTAGQHPGAIVLSCSDSRVPPELVFDQSLGDLFVVRTAGNVADAVALGSMEYAAEHLGARVLLVMGHEKCGAVTAAAQGGEVPSPNLKAVVDLIAPAVAPLEAKAKGAELVHLGVEANVEASLAHVLAASPVLGHLAETKQLVVKRAVYDLDSGTVRIW